MFTDHERSGKGTDECERSSIGHRKGRCVWRIPGQVVVQCLDQRGIGMFVRNEFDEPPRFIGRGHAAQRPHKQPVERGIGAVDGIHLVIDGGEQAG